MEDPTKSKEKETEYSQRKVVECMLCKKDGKECWNLVTFKNPMGLCQKHLDGLDPLAAIHIKQSYRLLNQHEFLVRQYEKLIAKYEQTS